MHPALASTPISLETQGLQSGQPRAPKQAEGIHSFDFLQGQWHVHNRRLRKRLAGCTDWETYEARQVCRLLMDGLANIDEMRTEAREPVGVTLRTFDHATGRWSLYWVGVAGVLEPPVTGTFEKGVGTFHGKDVFGGRPIDVRFIWSGITPTSARWEQAFSDDGGKTWETNWVMSFTRIRQ